METTREKVTSILAAPGNSQEEKINDILYLITTIREDFKKEVKEVINLDVNKLLDWCSKSSTRMTIVTVIIVFMAIGALVWLVYFFNRPGQAEPAQSVDNSVNFTAAGAPINFTSGGDISF